MLLYTASGQSQRIRSVGWWRSTQSGMMEIHTNQNNDKGPQSAGQVEVDPAPIWISNLDQLL